MGPDTLQALINAIAAQTVAAMNALIPIGQALTGSFIVLSILMLGTALVSGGTSIISPLVRMSAAGAGTYWAITYWADISRSTLNASRDVVALMIPGYSGPTTLFDMANQVYWLSATFRLVPLGLSGRLASTKDGGWDGS